MTFRFEHENVVWIDLENPTRDEVRDAVRSLDIGERIEEELISPTPAALVRTDGGSALLVLHFPTLGTSEPRDQEIDFVVGPAFLLTVHYDVIAAMHEFRKLLETGEALARAHYSTEKLLEALLFHLFESLRNEGENLKARLQKIEHEMFTREPKAIVRTISNVNREFLHLEAALSVQEEPLTRFFTELAKRGIFAEGFEGRAKEIMAERSRIARLLSTMRAIAAELRETNTDLLTTQQNEIMKFLTIMAFVTFPLSVITGIFGMDTQEKVILGSPHDFWIIIGLMVALTLSFFIFFRMKHWL